jgi:hypothetical protein
MLGDHIVNGQLRINGGDAEIHDYPGIPLGDFDNISADGV